MDYHLSEKQLKFDTGMVSQFIWYIKKNFNITCSFRELQDKIKKPGFLTFAKKHSKASFNYQENYQKKAVCIKNVITASDIKTIMDVGTESSDFLDALQETFCCKVYGVNIKDFGHFPEHEKLKTDTRFQYYELKLPYGVDLITLISVLHHIPELEKYIQEYCTRARYILIKEHDLTENDSLTKYFFDAQHDLYEQVFTDKPQANFRRYDININKLITEFAKHDFVPVNIMVNYNFSKTFYILFSKLGK